MNVFEKKYEKEIKKEEAKPKEKIRGKKNPRTLKCCGCGKKVKVSRYVYKDDDENYACNDCRKEAKKDG